MSKCTISGKTVFVTGAAGLLAASLAASANSASSRAEGLRSHIRRDKYVLCILMEEKHET